MDCINLQERFGRQYRVTYEESNLAQHGLGRPATRSVADDHPMSIRGTCTRSAVTFWPRVSTVSPRWPDGCGNCHAAEFTKTGTMAS